MLVSLEGTASKLIDYNVSSIYKTSVLAGSKGEYGSRNGTGDEARFGRLEGMVDYLDNTFLIADRDMHTIKRVTYDGVVSNLLDLIISVKVERVMQVLLVLFSGQIAADLSNGMYFGLKEEKFMDTMHPIIKFHYIMVMVIILMMGGIAVLNSNLFFG